FLLKMGKDLRPCRSPGYRAANAPTRPVIGPGDTNIADDCCTASFGTTQHAPDLLRRGASGGATGNRNPFGRLSLQILDCSTHNGRHSADGDTCSAPTSQNAGENG